MTAISKIESIDWALASAAIMVLLVVVCVVCVMLLRDSRKRLRFYEHFGKNVTEGIVVLSQRLEYLYSMPLFMEEPLMEKLVEGQSFQEILDPKDWSRMRLFFEETEWCWKAKNAGYRNICLSSTYIRHKGSASIDSIEGLHSYMMERNRVIFLRRNAPDKKTFCRAIIFLFLLYGRNGLLEDKRYFKYWGYMIDGLRNRVNRIKYPFINIPDTRC